MKKLTILLFTLSLILNLCACSLSNKIPSLEEIVENGAEWGNEQLQQSQGWTLADLEKVWGKADGELSGMYGYFWKVNDTVSVNVYYYKNAEIEHISVSDWKDGNNADGAETTSGEQTDNLALQDISICVAEAGGGDAFELLGKNAKTISQILSADSWVPDATNCASDYIVTYSGRTIYYHSECGTFNERLEQSNQSLRLSETDREIVNDIIRAVISNEPGSDRPVTIYYGGHIYSHGGYITYDLPDGFDFIGETNNVGNSSKTENFAANEDGYLYKSIEDDELIYFQWKEWDESVDGGKEPYLLLYCKEQYTYEELSEMPAEELLNLFIQNGLVINDDLKASYTEEELQTLFKEHFDMWHIGLSALSHTMYLDLAEQTKAIYDAILEKYIALDSDMVPIVNIVDLTKTEGFPYDMAEEKFFEDGDNEYYFSGIYSHYVIVHYEDGSQEDIVTALNAGRATIADLDKFEVDYIVKSFD